MLVDAALSIDSLFVTYELIPGFMIEPVFNQIVCP
jgi:hypothetical protein